jgi:hypothetical protein
LFLTIFAVLLLVPANGPAYNRLWNALIVPGNDLAMRPALAVAGRLSLNEAVGLSFNGRGGSSPADSTLFTTPSAGFVIMASGNLNVTYLANKLLLYPEPTPPAARVEYLLSWMRASNPKDRLLVLPSRSSEQTPISLAGYLSAHWLPQEVALDNAGRPELLDLARKLGGKEMKTIDTMFFTFGDEENAAPRAR